MVLPIDAIPFQLWIARQALRRPARRSSRRLRILWICKSCKWANLKLVPCRKCCRMTLLGVEMFWDFGNWMDISYVQCGYSLYIANIEPSFTGRRYRKIGQCTHHRESLVAFCSLYPRHVFFSYRSCTWCWHFLTQRWFLPGQAWWKRKITAVAFLGAPSVCTCAAVEVPPMGADVFHGFLLA